MATLLQASVDISLYPLKEEYILQSQSLLIVSVGTHGFTSREMI